MKFKKIGGPEAKIFALLLLFLPVNLGKHFIFDFCYVDGILVDYLIPTVYLTDILIWLLLVIWGLRKISSNNLTIQQFNNRSLILYSSFFILVSGLSALGAENQPAAVYKWLKLMEYILFAFYVSKHINLKRDWPTIIKLLSVGVLFESVLAVAQWFKQGSLFGYWFLGENKYTVSTPGIAILDFFGVKKVRAYGTFPHPNALSGYLAVVLPWVLHRGLKGIKGLKERGFYLLTLGLGLAALMLSFSRSAWVVSFLGLSSTLFLVLKFPSLIHNSLFLIPASLSFLRRAELNWMALKMFQDHPLLGVGLNNFTVRMSEYGKVSGWASFLQPVHNVYLLIAAETGLLGLIAFFGLLFSVFYLLLKKKNYLLLVSMSQVALLCFVDHYFFTLQQTALLFWLLVGLVFSTKKK
jgi:hypothetical protein